MDELIPQEQIQEELLELKITEVLERRLDNLNKRLEDLKIDYKVSQKHRENNYGR